ncbi:alpha/beta hydrolase [Oculatella sp. LEGE 06141]|uniref:alpha/beta fold hydrolase n=1 Tax=Oculatella sp. LEGE 06141 TaxID=1828648 RepID=UPI00187FDBCF|nr:alpha/beta hydrolase [Oculatella sp. LEGE 06141]MBE9181863.1 alpha/beta hydrolase [Oculatella sp. LEGE 06141]
MLQFQPPGFGQHVIRTSLGVMAYYTPTSAPWRTGNEQEPYPPLIFLHSLGGGSSAYEWSKVYPAFAPAFRVIAPDLIGWGQSTHPVRDYQIDDYLLMLTELIEGTGSKPATVVASSLTAGITLRLATQRPDLFQQLYLVCPSGYGDFGSDYSRGIAAQLAGIPGLDRLLYGAGAANETAVRSFLQQFLFAERSRITDEMVAAYVASAQQLNAEYAALASLKGNLCFDLALYMETLTVPTVMLWGDKAWFSTLKTGQRLSKLNPRPIKAFHTIPNSGVLPHLETPELVIGLLQSHLRYHQEPETD